MTDVIVLKDLLLELSVDVPDAFEDKTTYDIKWMRQVEKELFEVGLGTSVWMVRISGLEVTPISNAMFFSEDEAKIIDLCRSLNLSGADISNKILQRRANEYYTGEH